MKLTHHGSSSGLPHTTNPVHEVPEDEWKPSNIKCEHCQGECREAPPKKRYNQTITKLVNCRNRFHLNGEYGFYASAEL